MEEIKDLEKEVRKLENEILEKILKNEEKNKILSFFEEFVVPTIVLKEKERSLNKALLEKLMILSKK